MTEDASSKADRVRPAGATDEYLVAPGTGGVVHQIKNDLALPLLVLQMIVEDPDASENLRFMGQQALDSLELALGRVDSLRSQSTSAPGTQGDAGPHPRSEAG